MFAKVVESAVVLNEAGRIVESWWDKVAEHFTGVCVDQHVIMPNHVHAIVNIVGAGLGQVISFFKHQSAKQINSFRNNPGYPVWQRNYYERVIRNENELCRAREYIANNPFKWDMDKENPLFSP